MPSPAAHRPHPCGCNLPTILGLSKHYRIHTHVRVAWQRWTMLMVVFLRCWLDLQLCPPRHLHPYNTHVRAGRPRNPTTPRVWRQRLCRHPRLPGGPPLRPPGHEHQPLRPPLQRAGSLGRQRHVGVRRRAPPRQLPPPSRQLPRRRLMHRPDLGVVRRHAAHERRGEPADHGGGGRGGSRAARVRVRARLQVPGGPVGHAGLL